MRNRPQRLADLRAQWAANDLGERRLGDLIEREGAGEIAAGMREILDYAERRTRARLEELGDGDWEARDVLEGGPDGSEDIELRVKATISGSSSNSTSRAAQTRSRATSTARCRSPARPPSSACASCSTPTLRRAPGATGPWRSRRPEGSVLNASPGAAVAGGNVETSSRVADLVFAALCRAVATARPRGRGP